MKDNSGREYLKLDDAKDGLLVELDDGFTCARAGKTILFKGEHGLYFNCAGGSHLIDGQADNGVHCIGIYPTEQTI